MQSTIEWFEFELNHPDQAEAFIALQAEVHRWLSKQTGFFYRTLLQTEPGKFVDLFHWASEEDAKYTHETFMQQPFASDFVASIKEGSTTSRLLTAAAEVGYDSSQES